MVQLGSTQSVILPRAFGRDGDHRVARASRSRVPTGLAASSAAASVRYPFVLHRENPHRSGSLQPPRPTFVLWNAALRAPFLSIAAARRGTSTTRSSRLKNIGEISIAPAVGRDFGNSRRARSGTRAAAGASTSWPKGKRDRLPPLLALRFLPRARRTAGWPHRAR